jgi:membrane dipeptidase
MTMIKPTVRLRPNANLRRDARAHAINLMERHPLIDGHNDLPWVLRLAGAINNLASYDLTRVHPEADTDIPRLREGRVATQVLAAFLPTLIANPATVTLEQIDLILRLEDLHSDVFHRVRKPADVAAARRLGKIGSIVAVEGTVGLDGSLAPLRLWHRLGVRLITLCHNETLPWVDSATDVPTDTHGGLSEFGVRVIGEMNRLGLIIDMAHVAPHAMHKVLDASTAPVMITHSCATALCDHPRNTPDDVLARIPVNGGLIMGTFVPEFLNPAIWNAAKSMKDAYGKTLPGVTREQMKAFKRSNTEGWDKDGISYLADHFDYLRGKVGENHLGIGSDFYGGINPPGLEDASKFPDLIAELVARGWSDTALAKLMGGNFIRVWKAVLAKAEKA